MLQGNKEPSWTLRTILWPWLWNWQKYGTPPSPPGNIRTGKRAGRIELQAPSLSSSFLGASVQLPIEPWAEESNFQESPGLWAHKTHLLILVPSLHWNLETSYYPFLDLLHLWLGVRRERKEKTSWSYFTPWVFCMRPTLFLKATIHVIMLQAPNWCIHLLVQRLNFASSSRPGTWVFHKSILLPGPPPSLLELKVPSPSYKW